MRRHLLVPAVFFAALILCATGVTSPSQTLPPEVSQNAPNPQPRTIVLPPASSGVSSPTSHATQQDLPLPEGEPFAGRWDSDWGALHIDVKDGKATGMYQFKQGKIEGELSADGRTLTGYWYQEPSYTLGEDGGTFTFTLSPNRRSFEGFLWRGNDKSGKSRDFEAVFISPAAKPEKPAVPAPTGFAGSWESDWGKLELKVDGIKVLGTFAWNSGRVEGTLRKGGRLLQGHWRKAPTYEPGIDGGAFQLAMDEGGEVLRGHYWNGDERAGRGQTLTAVRAKETSAPAPATPPTGG